MADRTWDCLQAVQRVQVENTGDVGTKYSLDMAALGPHFTAFPGSGFLAPNQQAQVEITFHPKALNPDIRVDRVCLPCIPCKHSQNQLLCLYTQTSYRAPLYLETMLVQSTCNAPEC